jgi:DNA-binding HxlR family transcriptional regulator
MTQTFTCNVLDSNCPSRRALALLADKWVLLILVALAKHGTMRNGELKRLLGDISQKMLAQTLRRLEQNGLVARKAYDEIPPRVEYSLTPLGSSLMEPIYALRDWAETYYAEIEAAQAQHLIG